MKKHCVTLLLIALLLGLCQAAAAETLTGKTAGEIVNDMGVGFNLGNTFDATGYDANDIYAQEQSWGNPIVDQALMQRIRDAGFTSVRIPITWYRNVADDGLYTIDPAFMARIREVVDYAYACDLYVIINLHHEAWLNVKTLDQDYETIGVQLAAMWRQIADAFAEYDQHLIFEAMNEPRMTDTSIEWNGNKAGYAAVNYLNQVFVDTIRTDAKGYNGERCLMIPSYAASSGYAQMAAVTLPTLAGKTAENIAISIHCYSPYDFCLSDKLKVFDPDNKSHTNAIDAVFSNAWKLFLSKGIPVVIGETSATNTGNNTAERAKWAYYMGSKAAAYGIPILVWDNGNNQTSGGECHVWVRRAINEKLRSQRTPVPYPEVVESLMAGFASVAWGSGRPQPEPVKSMLNGKVIWADADGLPSTKEWDNTYIQVNSSAGWYGAGVQFAVIYEGSGSPKLVLDSAEKEVWWIPVDPDRTDSLAGKKVAWFSCAKVLAACEQSGVTDPAQLRCLSVMATGGSITTYEVCYIGK
ncbi:MAG: glycoside hydrolase family 5 protein [Aristaeellaceae bacterium]